MKQYLNIDSKGRGKINDKNQMSSCLPNKVSGPNFIFLVPLELLKLNLDFKTRGFGTSIPLPELC